MTDVYSSREISKTRKEHQCDACCKSIPTGSPAHYYFGVYCGDAYGGYQHVECRAAELALNKKYDTYGEDWQSLNGDCECEDIPWMAKEHPVVAERMGWRP